MCHFIQFQPFLIRAFLIRDQPCFVHILTNVLLSLDDFEANLQTSHQVLQYASLKVKDSFLIKYHNTIITLGMFVKSLMVSSVWFVFTFPCLSYILFFSTFYFFELEYQKGPYIMIG